ncbi:hypothetical protein AJ78_08188 [Emergomyces pasteurianus Ep9510]|uniref:Mid2 domain-containing protein n=1 Tax=Emergomyces pasteurianus Ep9510 TaxID=1447872 RepID=A0A1J9Q6Y8_9EURO|nr:hypothetical protein AJ78_08188 [Emergomyces pasteurianus Ep9510]
MARPTTSTISRLVVMLLSFGAIGARSQKRMCYALDGTEYPYDVPCTNDEETICCNQGDICMSNGLCFLQGAHASALSRGSCTDKNWGAGCFAPCANYNRHIGFPVVNFGYSGKDSKYCCGGVSIVDGKLGCMNGDASFTLPRGEAILGVAGLAGNNSSPNDPSTTTSTTNPQPTPTHPGTTAPTPSPELTCPTSHDTAIGVGIGVPLGVIALAALAWAMWERRGKRQALAAAAAGGAVYSAQTEYATQPYHQKNIAELPGRTAIAELMEGSCQRDT